MERGNVTGENTHYYQTNKKEIIMKRFFTIMSLCCLMFFSFNGCNGGSDSNDSYNPTIDPANFSNVITNQYLPMTPGTIYTYDNETPDGAETVTVEVTEQTKVIMGVTCIVVHDSSQMDGEILEDTYDWYAQDDEGNVWYFGEDTKSYENGVVASTAGSWEAGVDDAKPGIVMQALPVVGDSYRQEYLKDEAEDMAEVLNLSAPATVAYGTFENCLKTKEWSSLEPGVTENKYYAPGVGLILTVMVEGGQEREELINITTSDETYNSRYRPGKLRLRSG
jgi:hypothetical protein